MAGMDDPLAVERVSEMPGVHPDTVHHDRPVASIQPGPIHRTPPPRSP